MQIIFLSLLMFSTSKGVPVISSCDQCVNERDEFDSLPTDQTLAILLVCVKSNCLTSDSAPLFTFDPLVGIYRRHYHNNETEDPYKDLVADGNSTTLFAPDCIGNENGDSTSVQAGDDFEDLEPCDDSDVTEGCAKPACDIDCYNSPDPDQETENLDHDPTWDPAPDETFPSEPVIPTNKEEVFDEDNNGEDSGDEESLDPSQLPDGANGESNQPMPEGNEGNNQSPDGPETDQGEISDDGLKREQKPIRGNNSSSADSDEKKNKGDGKLSRGANQDLGEFIGSKSECLDSAEGDLLWCALDPNALGSPTDPLWDLPNIVDN